MGLMPAFYKGFPIVALLLFSWRPPAGYFFASSSIWGLMNFCLITVEPLL